MRRFPSIKHSLQYFWRNSMCISCMSYLFFSRMLQLNKRHNVPIISSKRTVLLKLPSACICIVDYNKWLPVWNILAESCKIWFMMFFEFLRIKFIFSIDNKVVISWVNFSVFPCDLLSSRSFSRSRNSSHDKAESMLHFNTWL